MDNYGCTFSFDGIDCSSFDLCLRNVGSVADGNTQIAGTSSIVEEALPLRWRPLFYGTRLDQKLSLLLTFGLTDERLDSRHFLSREEVLDISNWLARQSIYKPLVINAEGLEDYTFMCMVGALTFIGNDGEIVAVQATFTCDSPFAYARERGYVATNAAGTGTAPLIEIDNISGIPGYYCPVVEYTTTGGGTLSIVNESDNDREFKLSDLPGSVTNVTIDNENMVITNNANLNLYEYCNYKFLRLVPGINKIRVSGTGSVNIKCKFPVNVGGYLGG